MLQQRAHIATNYATHDGLHVDSVLTQPKVKISKPEDLVESRGDVSYNYKVWGFFKMATGLACLCLDIL